MDSTWDVGHGKKQSFLGGARIGCGSGYADFSPLFQSFRDPFWAPILDPPGVSMTLKKMGPLPKIMGSLTHLKRVTETPGTHLPVAGRENEGNSHPTQRMPRERAGDRWPSSAGRPRLSKRSHRREPCPARSSSREVRIRVPTLFSVA